MSTLGHTNEFGDLAMVAMSETKTLEVGSAKYAYREYGFPNGVPLVLLTHLAANLDNWDPAVLALLSANRYVVAFDNLGVGSSSGRVPTSLQAMAYDAIAFIKAMKFERVDLLGLSMGGMVAQELVSVEPTIVRKLVLVGTGPRGGAGIEKVTRVTFRSIMLGQLTKADPKEFIFFKRNETGISAAKTYLARLELRTRNKDVSFKFLSLMRQLKAIRRFALDKTTEISSFHGPALILNGDYDIIVPTPLSNELHSLMPGSKIKIYPDSGHGSLFQYPVEFSADVLEFLG